MAESTDIPDDVRGFLESLLRSYDDVFKTEFQSACAGCQPRLVHRDARCFELGNTLVNIKKKYNL